MKGPIRKDYQQQMTRSMMRDIDRIAKKNEGEMGKERARDYARRVVAEREGNRAMKNIGNPLQRKLQSRVPALSESEYIAENGIDRDDRDLFAKNRGEFKRRVGATVTRNLAKEALRREFAKRKK